MATVQVTGIDRALKNIARLAGSMNAPAAKRVYVKAAWRVALRASYLAPYDSKRKKGTHLRDAILVSPGPLFYSNALVGVRYRRPGAPHAHLVEFGTTRMQARPFMRPAAVSTAGEVQVVLREGLEQVIASTVK